MLLKEQREYEHAYERMLELTHLYDNDGISLATWYHEARDVLLSGYVRLCEDKAYKEDCDARWARYKQMTGR